MEKQAQTQPKKLESYEMNFDVLLNKTVTVEAVDEDEAIGKLQKMLDAKDILRAHVNNLSYKIVKK